MRSILPLAFLLAACAHGSCAHSPAPAPSDATCASACAHGAALSCTYAKPTIGGATCEQVCKNAEAAGEPWRLACLSRLQTCDDATACP
jgi:hypothetical protein